MNERTTFQEQEDERPGLPPEDAAPIEPDSGAAPPQEEDGGAEDAAWTGRARRMGWVPKAEWRGPPDKWRPAREFVERAENNTPILITQIRQLDQKLEASERDRREQTKRIEELSGTLTSIHEWAKRADERALATAKRDLEARLREAATSADPERVIQISAELSALDKGSSEAKSPPPSPPPPPAPVDASDPPARDPIVDAWVQSNQWWFLAPDSVDMKEDAIALFGTIKTRNPTWTTEQHLSEVLKRIRTMYPEKFRNARRADPPATAEPTPGGAPRRKAFGYDDLPADAKQQCDRFVRDIKGYTKEEYVKEYVRQNGTGA